MNNFIYHTPVLLNKSIYGLVTDPNGVYVDATYGSGGTQKRSSTDYQKKSYLHLIKILTQKKNLISDARFFYQF